MTKRVSITLNDAQYAILRHYAGTLGMTDAYALRMAALRDLLDWHAKTMVRDRQISDPVKHDVDELDEEFA